MGELLSGLWANAGPLAAVLVLASILAWIRTNRPEDD